jgi:hypothetical protein
VQDCRELPGQIDRIMDAGVHALTASGRVDVRRIANEEDGPPTERRSHALVHAVAHHPARVLEGDASKEVRPLQEAKEVGEIDRVSGGPAGVPGEVGPDDAVLAVRHRDHRRRGIASDEDVGRVCLDGVLFDLRLRQQELGGIGGAFEGDAGALAHPAARAVGTDDVAISSTDEMAVWHLDHRDGSPLIDVQFGQAMPPLDVVPPARQPADENVLGVGLGQDEVVGVGRLLPQHAEIEAEEFSAHVVEDHRVGAAPTTHELAVEFQHAHELERAGVDAERARLDDRTAPNIDDFEGNAGSREEAGQGEPDGPSADDEYVGGLALAMQQG